MAANYWESTQRKYWQFTKEQLASLRSKLEEDNAELVRMFPLPQTRHLNIYFNLRKSLYVIRKLATDPRVSRVESTSEAVEYSTAIDSYRPSLHQTILYKGRDPSNESIPRLCDRLVPRMQDGRVSAAY